MNPPDDVFEMTGAAEFSEETPLITLEGAGSLTISQQRSVTLDELGNQELFWLRLTLPFTLHHPVTPDKLDSLTLYLKEHLAAKAGRLMLELLADHEHRTAAAVTPNEPPLPEMAPGHEELF